MQDYMFSEAALVEIQGNHALDFVCRERDYAEYKVPGCADQINIRDYRYVGLQAIDEVNQSKKISEFPYRFNTPALVKISDLGLAQLCIELYDTAETDPANRLWIAVGTTDLPVYEYIHKRIVPFDDAFALVALYRRNPNQMLSSSLVLTDA